LSFLTIVEHDQYPKKDEIMRDGDKEKREQKLKKSKVEC